eukprot:2358072-Pyramimonas_sp.AAC.1
MGSLVGVATITAGQYWNVYCPVPVQLHAVFVPSKTISINGAWLFSVRFEIAAAPSAHSAPRGATCVGSR